MKKILLSLLLSTQLFAGIGPFPGGSGGGGGGGGSVTSVGLADGSSVPIYTITNSPVTSSGTLTFTLKTESAGTVFAGPASGGDAQPGFRALAATDLTSLLPINLASGSSTTGVLPVARGGSGTNSLTSNNLIVGNGTSPINFLAPGASGTVVQSNGTSFSSATIFPVNLASGSSVIGVAPVANGGTGTNSLTANNVVLGNGTSPVNFVAPSTSGNVLTSNGTTWVSSTPAASGGSINVGSATANRIIAYQAANGSSVIVRNTGWAEATSTAAITNQSGFFGSATNPLLDLTSGAGSGTGWYTDASGNMYNTMAGSNTWCLKSTGMFFGTCATTSANIFGSAGNMNISAGTGDGKTVDINWGSSRVMEFSGAAGQGTAATMFGSLGLFTTNQSGTTYTVTYPDTIINMTNTGGRTVTLIGANGGRIGSGWFLIIKDAAGVAATAGTSIRVVVNAGATIDGTLTETYINTNYGVLRIYAKGNDWMTW